MGPYQGGQAEYLRAPFADLAMLSDIFPPATTASRPPTVRPITQDLCILTNRPRAARTGW
jgi:hypothetical protein